MGLTLGHGAWQIDQPSNGSMWNSYSFQPVVQWMGYSFTDLGAEGCCRSLNALFLMKIYEFHLMFSVILLKHWGRDKMATISQTTLSNAFFFLNIWISLNISLKFVPKFQINSSPALVQIVGCCLMVSLLTHICITQSQCVNTLGPEYKMADILQTTFLNAFSWKKIIWCILIRILLKFVPKGPIIRKSVLFQLMAWCRTGDKPLPDAEPMLTYCQLDPQEQT